MKSHAYYVKTYLGCAYYHYANKHMQYVANFEAAKNVNFYMIEKASFLIFAQNIHVDYNENLQSIIKNKK